MPTYTQQNLPNMPPNKQEDWGGYIDVRMDEENRRLWKDWDEANGGDVLGWLIDCIGQGLKLGGSWDGENNCYVSSLNGQGVKGSTKRFTLTARASSIPEAFSILCYKHYVLLEGDWGNFRPSQKNQRNWG